MFDKEELEEELDSNSPVVYIALSILCMKQDSFLPELLYMFSPKQIIDFIKIFSGETIKVPTVDEFRKIVLTALAAYHLLVQDKSLDWFAVTYEIDGYVMNSVNSKLGHWLNSLSEAEKQFIERLKAHEKGRREGDRKAREILSDGIRR